MTKHGSTPFLILLLIHINNINASDDPRLVSLTQRSGYPSHTVGFYMKCLETDSTVAAMEPDLSLVPASITKLVTGCAVYDLLGPNYTFKTRIYTAAPGAPGSGEVSGNLYVTGGGDPGLLAERMWLLVKQINFAGVQKINGNLVMDESFFDSVTTGPGYAQDKSSRAYEAPIGALSASWNALAVYCRPGPHPGDPVAVSFLPGMPNARLSNTARTTASTSKSTIQVSTQRQGSSTVITVSGTMPAGGKPAVIYQKVWQTAEVFGDVMTALFSQCGITFNGTVIISAAPDSIKRHEPLLVFESQPLSEFMRFMFKSSSNYTADMLFKTISAEARGGMGGSWDSSSALVGRWWKKAGLPGEPVLRNGSGMGTFNRLSARQTVAVLQHAWEQKAYFPDYFAAMSNAGIDGTLKNRFRSSRLRGMIRGKTGTLNTIGASSLAGYVLLNGKTYAFAVIINAPSHTQYQHWTLQESLVESLFP